MTHWRGRRTAASVVAMAQSKNHIVRRFGMPRLRDAVYGVKYKGLKLSKVKHVQH
jgi:hypothetical protein